jgi:hypothetical protein
MGRQVPRGIVARSTAGVAVRPRCETPSERTRRAARWPLAQWTITFSVTSSPSSIIGALRGLPQTTDLLEMTGLSIVCWSSGVGTRGRKGGAEAVGPETDNTATPIVEFLGGTPTAAHSDVIRPDK